MVPLDKLGVTRLIVMVSQSNHGELFMVLCRKRFETVPYSSPATSHYSLFTTHHEPS